MIPTRTDVVVIGAGQAGLSVGYFLKQRGCDFVMLDAGSEIGQVWRNRWDSLRLFTPAEYDGLPGEPFPAADGTHPSKDVVAGYLQDYARRYALPIHLDTAVTRVRKASGAFLIETSHGGMTARQVVIATGPFQRPHIPDIAGSIHRALPQLHSAEYRNPSQFPLGGRVLVVGAANSGLQIADELSQHHAVTVAVGSTPPRLPQRLLGQDVFTWLNRLGVMTRPADDRLSRRLRARGDVVIGSSPRQMRSRGVEFRTRLVGFDGRRAMFADGSAAHVDAVVWATGYRSDYTWLDVPGAVADGRIRHNSGVTAVPGLHVIGLPWQTSRGSALLGFVGRDAAQVVERVTTYVPNQRRTSAHAAVLSLAHSST